MPTQSITERIVHSVADQCGTDPMELPPLYGSLDSDALEACIESLSSGKVRFQYAGCSVVVYSDGTVTVAENHVGGLNPVRGTADD